MIPNCLKTKNYYNHFNAYFTIHTWYGIEIKGGLENNDGVFLNPENNNPANGLYHLGISVPLLKDLVINPRMAILKQAKLFIKQTEFDNRMIINQILNKAIKTYIDWVKDYKEISIYEKYLNNSQQRFLGIKQSVEAGDKPAIDSVEANINVKNREIDLEKSLLSFRKKTLELSNFLWLNDVPLEIKPDVTPEIETYMNIDEYIGYSKELDVTLNLNTHPKIQSLNYKIEQIEIERKLKKNNLLPTLDFHYNILTPSNNFSHNLNINNYKAGLSFNFPLFLRKERADLKLIEYKQQESLLEQDYQRLHLSNATKNFIQEIESYQKQNTLATENLDNYLRLLEAEEIKFNLGESSIFLINSRESSAIINQLKIIEYEYLIMKSKNDMMYTLGLYP